MNITHTATFSIGMIVKHKLFNYYGVIYDVDHSFMGTDQWFDTMAITRPPKDKPWYRVLVDQQESETYVAERNLEYCEKFREISHPLVTIYFRGHNNNQYILRTPTT